MSGWVYAVVREMGPLGSGPAAAAVGTGLQSVIAIVCSASPRQRRGELQRPAQPVGSPGLRRRWASMGAIAPTQIGQRRSLCRPCAAPGSIRKRRGASAEFQRPTGMRFTRRKHGLRSAEADRPSGRRASRTHHSRRASATSISAALTTWSISTYSSSEWA